MSNPIVPVYTYVLENEDGWNDDPIDPGGPTNFGLTLADANNLSSHPADPLAWLQSLTPSLAMDAISELYVTPYNLFQLSDLAIRAKTLDNVLWLGPSTGIQILQRACIAAGHLLDIDGLLGPATQTAANATDPTTLNALMAARTVHHALRILTTKPNLEPFREGWLRRALRIPSLHFGA